MRWRGSISRFWFHIYVPVYCQCACKPGPIECVRGFISIEARESRALSGCHHHRHCERLICEPAYCKCPPSRPSPSPKLVAHSQLEWGSSDQAVPYGNACPNHGLRSDQVVSVGLACASIHDDTHITYLGRSKFEIQYSCLTDRPLAKIP